MSMYTTEEKIQIVTWNLSGNSLRRTSELFSVFYPDRPIPSVNSIRNILKKFKSTGCVNNTCKRKKVVKNQDRNKEIDILAAVEMNPSSSIRQIGNDYGTSHSSVLRVLKENKYFSYKYHKIQEIFPEDVVNRNTFCEIMMERCNENPNFVKNICFTDESTFTINGAPNKQTCRNWYKENPHIAIPLHTQYPQKVNVWVGMFGNNIIGPFFINGTLNAQKYLNMLQDQICPAIRAVAEDFGSVIYQHDGAPAHNAMPIRNFLNEMFPDRWIGRGGAIHWPARSPDLAPNDFYLWGYLKSKLFTVQRHRNLDSVRDKIVEICFNISPQTLQNVHRHFYERLGHCLAVGGTNFEHLL